MGYIMRFFEDFFFSIVFIFRWGIGGIVIVFFVRVGYVILDRRILGRLCFLV